MRFLRANKRLFSNLEAIMDFPHPAFQLWEVCHFKASALFLEARSVYKHPQIAGRESFSEWGNEAGVNISHSNGSMGLWESLTGLVCNNIHSNLLKLIVGENSLLGCRITVQAKWWAPNFSKISGWMDRQCTKLVSIILVDYCLCCPQKSQI